MPRIKKLMRNDTLTSLFIIYRFQNRIDNVLLQQTLSRERKTKMTRKERKQKKKDPQHSYLLLLRIILRFMHTNVPMLYGCAALTQTQA